MERWERKEKDKGRERKERGRKGNKERGDGWERKVRGGKKYKKNA